MTTYVVCRYCKKTIKRNSAACLGFGYYCSLDHINAQRAKLAEEAAPRMRKTFWQWLTGGPRHIGDYGEPEDKVLTAQIEAQKAAQRLKDSALRS